MSPLRRLVGIGSLLLSLVAVACRPEESPPLDMVARVGESAIRTEDLETYFRRQVGERAAGLDSIVLSRLLDRRIQEELLRLLAVDEGWIDEEASRQAALSALAERAASLTVSDEAVARFYRDNPERFRRPPRVRLRHVMTPDRASAEEARSRVLAGEDFSDVARALSEAPTAARGGEQKPLEIDDLAAPFREVVEALEPGQTSPILDTADGSHLFFLESREAAERLPLELAEETIREELFRGRVEALERSLVEEAMARYDVTVYRRNLPFQYQGRFP